MDGKLTGRLSLNHHLTCRLTVTPRDGPAPLLITKTVNGNGTYRAVDEKLTASPSSPPISMPVCSLPTSLISPAAMLQTASGRSAVIQSAIPMFTR